MTTLLANSKKVQFSGKAKEITVSAHFRLMILLLVFLAAFTIIVGRLVSLTILEDAAPYRAAILSTATALLWRGRCAAMLCASYRPGCLVTKRH